MHLILETGNAARHGIRLFLFGQAKRLDNPCANLLRSTGPAKLLEGVDHRTEVANELGRLDGAL